MPHQWLFQLQPLNYTSTRMWTFWPNNIGGNPEIWPTSAGHLEKSVLHKYGSKARSFDFFFFFLSTWSPWNIAATEYSELKFKPPQIKSSKIVSFEKQSVLHSWGLKSLWKFQCSRSRQKCKFKSRTSIFPSIIFDWKFRGLCLYLAAGVRKNEFLILNSEFPKTNLTTLIHYLFPLNGQLLLLLLLLFLLKPMNMNRHLMCRLPFIPPCTTNLRFHYLFVQSNTQGMTLFNMKLWHLSCTNFQLYLFIAPYIQNCNNRRFTIQQNIQYKMKIKQLKYNIFEQ